MQILYVHGMGRSPISALPSLLRYKAKSFEVATFTYFVSVQNFPSIRDRLIKKICTIAAQGEYVLVGHSLGGVLLRAALAELPEGALPPARLFLLGSPVSASAWAKKFSTSFIFRRITGDCGNLLGSDARMSAIAAVQIPITSIIGTKGINGHHSVFGNTPNDGIVSVEETSARWIAETVEIPVIHTLLPSSSLVTDIILQRLGVRC